MSELKETKELLTFGVKLVDEIYDVTADGKVTAMEAFQSGFSLFKSGKTGIEGIKEVGVELQEATQEQLDSLKDWFANEFEIANDNVEAMIELALDTAVHLLKSAFMFQKLRKEGTKDFAGIENIEDVLRTLDAIDSTSI